MSGTRDARSARLNAVALRIVHPLIMALLIDVQKGSSDLPP